MPRKIKFSTPEHLIIVAQQLFAKKGFQATTVQDIARKANVNVSLISYHFNGKVGLFRACIERAASLRLEAAKNILTKPKTVDEMRVRLEMFTDEILIYHVENPDVCTIIHRDLHSEMKLIGDIFEKSLLKAFETFVDFILHSKDKGFIADWVDPQQTAGNFYGILFHIGKNQEIAKKYMGQSISDPIHRREVRDYLIRTTIEGIKP